MSGAQLMLSVRVWQEWLGARLIAKCSIQKSCLTLHVFISQRENVYRRIRDFVYEITRGVVKFYGLCKPVRGEYVAFCYFGWAAKWDAFGVREKTVMNKIIVLSTCDSTMQCKPETLGSRVDKSYNHYNVLQSMMWLRSRIVSSTSSGFWLKYLDQIIDIKH